MSAPAGGAAIEQIGLQRKIRLIGVSDDVVASAEWAKQLAITGETTSQIAPGTYSGQVNDDEEITVPAYAMVFAVNKSMDDDMAYKITKTYWDNIGEYKKSVAELRSCRRATRWPATTSPCIPARRATTRNRASPFPTR